MIGSINLGTMDVIRLKPSMVTELSKLLRRRSCPSRSCLMLLQFSQAPMMLGSALILVRKTPQTIITYQVII